MSTEASKKTNEQLHAEFEQALQTLSEKLGNLLHYGSYELSYINRSLTNDAVTWVTMKVGEHTLTLQPTSQYFPDREGTEVRLLLPDNPVTQEMLDSWDRQTLQRDIDYHKKELEKLNKRKEFLGLRDSLLENEKNDD